MFCRLTTLLNTLVLYPKDCYLKNLFKFATLTIGRKPCKFLKQEEENMGGWTMVNGVPVSLTVSGKAPDHPLPGDTIIDHEHRKTFKVQPDGSFLDTGACSSSERTASLCGSTRPISVWRRRICVRNR